MAEQVRMRAELRRARYGHLLAVHLLLLCAAGHTPSEIAAVLFCSRSSVYRVVKAYRAGTLSFNVPTITQAGGVGMLRPALQGSLLALLGTVPWACGWCARAGVARHWPWSCTCVGVCGSRRKPCAAGCTGWAGCGSAPSWRPKITTPSGW